MSLQYQSMPIDDKQNNEDMETGIARPTEDYTFTQIAILKSRQAPLSKLAKEILRLELRLLMDKQSAIYSTRFLHYFTRAGLCTIAHNHEWIYHTIHKCLLSYGYDNILWQDVRDYLEIYLDIAFFKDDRTVNRLSALQFLPKAWIKNKDKPIKN